jgi:RimJ/RimL family protein N-acetyltransferase
MHTLGKTGRRKILILARMTTPGHFDPQPTLPGARLELRPLRPEDYDALYAAASDPLIWELHPESDRHKPEVFRGFFDGAIKSGSALGVYDRSTGRLIGSSRYYDLDEDKREVAIGFTFLSREYWGGSYNRELKTLMLDHAFRFVDAVIFHVGENNVRSRKAMEKIGGALCGTRVKPARDGSLRTDVIFRIEKKKP